MGRIWRNAATCSKRNKEKQRRNCTMLKLLSKLRGKLWSIVCKRWKVRSHPWRVYQRKSRFPRPGSKNLKKSWRTARERLKRARRQPIRWRAITWKRSRNSSSRKRNYKIAYKSVHKNLIAWGTNLRRSSQKPPNRRTRLLKKIDSLWPQILEICLQLVYPIRKIRLKMRLFKPKSISLKLKSQASNNT